MSDTADPPVVTQGACRGGPTLALTEASGEMFAECIACAMIVDAGQTEHFMFGFRARCEGIKQ